MNWLRRLYHKLFITQEEVNDRVGHLLVESGRPYCYCMAFPDKNPHTWKPGFCPPKPMEK